jgi:hypothetical protein
MVVMGFKERAVERPECKQVLERLGLLRDGKVRPCVISYDILNKTFYRSWLNKYFARVVGCVDVAFSDALYDGLGGGCTERGARPERLDLLRIDVDVGENWRGVARRIYLRLRLRGIDARYMFSGNKDFHIWLVMPKIGGELPPAAWRPYIIDAIATIARVEVDRAAMDPARKLRLPYSIHTETGRYTYFFNPETGDEEQFTWPAPLPEDFVKNAALLTPPQRPLQRQRLARGANDALKAVEAVIRRILERQGWERLRDGRARLSHVYGCACAASGLALDECIERFKALVEDGERYIYNVKYHYGKCAKGWLFDVNKLCGGGAWYSVAELC